MNTQAYKGIAPRTTPALRHERAMRNLMGDAWVDSQNADRVEYYKSLIKKAKRS